jgi:Ca2+/Na+ antiporter
MRIDRTHHGWLMGTIAALVVSAIAYVPYALSARGPRGGSVIGLVYGSIGFAFMLFAGLLGLRKRFPVWRIGRAQSWMRAHLWLGFLAFPLILFHGGFHFGGTLTRVLMWMFTFVFVSGIAGAVIQHYMPRTHTAELPMETIYEQIDHVRDQLVLEAGKIVDEACAALGGELSHASERQLAVAASAGTNWDTTVADGLNADERAGEQLRQFFLDEALPFLEKSGGRGYALADPMRGSGLFQQLRLNLPPNLHGVIDSLETQCEEKRQLDRQKRMHLVLHGWLLVHVPLSYAVLLLGAIHAVVALKY